MKQSKKEIMEVIIEYFLNQLVTFFKTFAVLDENEEEREYIDISSYSSQSKVQSQIQTSDIRNQVLLRLSKDFSR